MRTARIGSLEVSVIGLGCNTFGRGQDQDSANAIVAASLDAGVTYFDTADIYGEGQSESFLAKALGSRRDEVVVATKFGHPVPGLEGTGGAEPAYVRHAVERSLRELDTDYIDLYQLHRPKPPTPIADTIGAMLELVDEGKVREIAWCNASADESAEAAAAGPRTFVSNQIEYSLINRDPEKEGQTAFAEANSIAVIPYRPLAKGMLTGRHQRGGEVAGTSRLASARYDRYRAEECWDLIERLRPFCAERDVSMGHVALAWLLSRQSVPAVIPGASNPEQARDNAAAGSFALSEEDVAELDALAGPPL